MLLSSAPEYRVRVPAALSRLDRADGRAAARPPTPDAPTTPPPGNRRSPGPLAPVNTCCPPKVCGPCTASLRSPECGGARQAAAPRASTSKHCRRGEPPGGTPPAPRRAQPALPRPVGMTPVRPPQSSPRAALGPLHLSMPCAPLSVAPAAVHAPAGLPACWCAWGGCAVIPRGSEARAQLTVTPALPARMQAGDGGEGRRHGTHPPPASTHPSAARHLISR